MRTPSSFNTMAILFCAAILFAGIDPATAQLAGATSCGPDVNTSPSTIPPPQSITNNAISDAVRCLINAERTTRGLPALSVNPHLVLAAHQYAQEAGRLKWWTAGNNPHVHPETGPREPNNAIAFRINVAGYCAEGATFMSEIAYTGTGTGSTPAAAVNWWMNISTQGHREAILEPRIRELGVGYVREGADGTVPPQTQMGSYVVNFGGCPSIAGSAPPAAPPAASGGQGNTKVSVHFTNMRVNDCPEVGTCDWKLVCSLGNQPAEELLSQKEGNTGEDVKIGRALVQAGGLPVTVTCTVNEHDGPFLFFDNPVWEHVGTRSIGITTSGRSEIQINQNRSEGDVTVRMEVEVLGTVQVGSTVEPPFAPRGCRIPAASSPICGNITIECEGPLPTADTILVGDLTSTLGFTVWHVDNRDGRVRANYFREGDALLTVCAGNRGGQRCSNTFVARLGPILCPAPPPVARPCPSGETLCPNRGCVPVAQCNFLQ